MVHRKLMDHLEILHVRGVLHNRVVDLGLPGKLLQVLDGGLHALHGEEGGQVGGEGGQHEDDKQPVGGHKDPGGEGLGGLPATLGREGGEGEPEGLLEGELPAGPGVGLLVVPRGVGGEPVQHPEHQRRHYQGSKDGHPNLRLQHLGKVVCLCCECATIPA